MEPLQSLTRFWNWLPQLRAIAESCHLPTAARELGVTPSALSRSLNQLERVLGCPLFLRSGRRLELLPMGERFLAALRDAMRLVHEAAEQLRDERWQGALRVASTGVATSVYVLPALLELRRLHPQLAPELTTDVSELAARLLSGKLDIAFVDAPVAHKRLRTILVGSVPRGIYCGPDHPLRERTALELSELADHPFVAPPCGASGMPEDGWPAHGSRVIGFEVNQIGLGCEAIRSAPLLAVLPDPIAAAFGGGVLHRLPVEVAEPAVVHAVLRTSIGEPTRAEMLLAEVLRRASAAREPDGSVAR